MTEANRALVRHYYERLWSAGAKAAIGEMLADDYVEHQYSADFSQEGLLRHVRERRAAYPDHRVTIHHSLSEGDLVFLLAEESLALGADVARAELFRVADGRIVEHWSSHVRDEKNRRNANGTFDGSRVDRSVDYAARFGDWLERLDAEGFGQQRLEAFRESRPDDYIQHSPNGADRLDGLLDLLAKMKAAGMRMTMRHHRTLRDGDFLVSHRLYDSEPKHPLVSRINTFDMFRLDATGKAVEHWDVMEEVPTPEMLDRMF